MSKASLSSRSCLFEFPYSLIRFQVFWSKNSFVNKVNCANMFSIVEPGGKKCDGGPENMLTRKSEVQKDQIKNYYEKKIPIENCG